MALFEDESPSTGEKLLNDAASDVDHYAINDSDADTFRQGTREGWYTGRVTGLMGCWINIVGRRRGDQGVCLGGICEERVDACWCGIKPVR